MPIFITSAHRHHRTQPSVRQPSERSAATAAGAAVPGREWP